MIHFERLMKTTKYLHQEILKHSQDSNQVSLKYNSYIISVLLVHLGVI
jgi:hypothetical protein